MSRFFSGKFDKLVAYTPGEQPRDMVYLKLNTNESPYEPAPGVMEAIQNARSLRLYSDPECMELRKKIAEIYNVTPGQVLVNNGSDEGLLFAFQAFCDQSCGAAFCDITYGFYPVFANYTQVPYTEIPLKEDFTINTEEFFGLGKTIFIANPNAPTGIALSPSEIEEILKANPDNVVVIDEAYVDFGCESVIPLVDKYPNLLVTRTFSKSRSLAGARLGFCIGSEELIKDLNTIRYSTNPYNVNSLTMAAGLACLENDSYNMENCREIASTREWITERLEGIGFEVLPSKANFIFARHVMIPGNILYEGLKYNGVLVRYFNKPRISDYVRITIGTREQMKRLEEEVVQILCQRGGALY